MIRVLYFCLLNTLLDSSKGNRDEPRYYSQSKGEVWPKPWQETKSQEVFDVDPTKIKFNIQGKNCTKIDKAIERCKHYLQTLSNISKRNPKDGYDAYKVQDTHQDLLKELQINLSTNCDEYPYYNMDESYNLTVSNISVLKSSSIWGIIRGMETFSQLFYLQDNFNIVIRGTDIVDYPNYPHRGLMLDTAKHYLSVENILKTLDAMAMNKMNVFHWHMVDDESFPYQSVNLPELTKSAYYSSMIYTQSDIKNVKDYASDLGIRILMEIDVPGHSSYWELSYPEILTNCPYYAAPAISRPINPLKNESYGLLKILLQEVQELLSDDHFHLGGDEVEFGCWTGNTEIEEYMADHNITNVNNIFSLFYKNTLPLLKKTTIPVVWEDVFNADVVLPKNTVIQTWGTGDGSNSMIKVLKAGYRGIQSAPYSLDKLNREFPRFYKNEPRLAVKGKLKNDTLLQNLVGGTACMWGEMVDDVNVLSRVWPRACGIAEVLWSETEGVNPDDKTILRIEEQTCRMRRRGVPAEPSSGPSFCIL